MLGVSSTTVMRDRVGHVASFVGMSQEKVRRSRAII